MMNRFDVSYINLFIISFLFYGCRIGNHIESPTTEDLYTGYYTSLPLSLSFTVTNSTTSVSKVASVDLIPSEISLIMTNPVHLTLSDLTTGKATLEPTNGTTQSLPTHVYSGSVLAFQATLPPQTFWKETSCQVYFEIIEQGQILTKPPIPPIPGNTLPLVGQIQMAFQITHYLQGNCEADLATVSLCYTDATQCGGSSTEENGQLQTNAQSLFQPYVNAGTTTASDISQLKSYGYTAIYQ